MIAAAISTLYLLTLELVNTILFKAPIQVALNNMVLTSSSVKRYNVDMAAAIIAGFPTLVVYVLAGKYFIRGLTAGSVKG